MEGELAINCPSLIYVTPSDSNSSRSSIAEGWRFSSKHLISFGEVFNIVVLRRQPLLNAREIKSAALAGLFKPFWRALAGEEGVAVMILSS